MEGLKVEGLNLHPSHPSPRYFPPPLAPTSTLTTSFQVLQYVTNILNGNVGFLINERFVNIPAMVNVK